jgi:hypothetical protein
MSNPLDSSFDTCMMAFFRFVEVRIEQIGLLIFFGSTKVVVELTTIEVVVEIITSSSPPSKLYSLESLKEKQIDLQNLQRNK